jgi:hypothetical protein
LISDGALIACTIRLKEKRLECLEANESDRNDEGGGFGTTQRVPAASDAAESRSENPRKTRRNGSSRDILVIDDNPDIRDALVGALEEQGFRALSASNGLEALKILRSLHTAPSVF